MPRPLVLMLALLLCAGMAACGSSKRQTPGTAKQPAATKTTPPPPSAAGCGKASAPRPRAPQRLPKPALKLNPRNTYRARVETSCGSFTITLEVKRAPRTAASFVSLARRSFYDGLTFHRVVNQFVIQGGDPSGNGTGGPGYKTVEAPPGGLKYTRGVVAMAKGQIEDPGTAGSQFFVVTGEDAQLPAEYALLGKVTQGQEVADTIGVVRTDPSNDRPVEPVVIRSIRILETKGG